MNLLSHGNLYFFFYKINVNQQPFLINSSWMKSSVFTYFISVDKCHIIPKLLWIKASAKVINVLQKMAPNRLMLLQHWNITPHVGHIVRGDIWLLFCNNFTKIMRWIEKNYLWCGQVKKRECSLHFSKQFFIRGERIQTHKDSSKYISKTVSNVVYSILLRNLYKYFSTKRNFMNSYTLKYLCGLV